MISASHLPYLKKPIAYFPTKMTPTEIGVHRSTLFSIDMHN
jgi:hypothetical protein